MNWRMLLVAALAVGPSASALAQDDPTWVNYVLWEPGEKVQSVAFGDADPTRPGIEAAGVTAGGAVGLGGMSKGEPWGMQIYKHNAKLYSVFIGDVDPNVPGAELYVGGVGSTTPGEILQLVRTKDGWRTKTIWRGDGLVHSMARLAPKRKGEPAELVVPTYSGKLYLARPKREGIWTTRLLHEEAFEGDTARLLLKDMVTGAVGGLRGRNIFFTTKAGRAILLDADRPGSARLIHSEKGGMARITMDRKGVVYASCNDGNVLRMTRSRKAWKVDTIFHDSDELRGVRVGKFRLAGGMSTIAIYGYSGHVRALVPGKKGWTSVSLFKDTDKSHHLDAVDMIEGNDSDELLIGGYSERMVLIARRGPSRAQR